VRLDAFRHEAATPPRRHEAATPPRRHEGVWQHRDTIHLLPTPASHQKASASRASAYTVRDAMRLREMQQQQQHRHLPGAYVPGRSGMVRV
jgi:hypothetical protein